ncbi:hypothetical protein FA95DRAFT_77307 [Auriscalpium vulgare]|uniref:Uncharacterized protein n=1 Tax=Auriscalpium vulgare TaxID=40419 RepID=A0ACB8RP56_9AGAM|nr:hypothetical protein FA95DRAFT_77307 [Auriscalpium vulgare]
MPRVPLHLTRLLRQPSLPTPPPAFPRRVTSLISRAPPAFSSILPSTRSSLLGVGALLPFPRLSTALVTPLVQQVRHAQRGNEYQPSQRVRKRRHGFLARKRSLGGRKILERRKAKKRKFLSH